MIWKPSPQFVFPQFNEIYRRTFFVAEKYLLIDFLSTIAFLIKKTVQSITNFFWVDFHDKRGFIVEGDMREVQGNNEGLDWRW